MFKHKEKRLVVVSEIGYDFFLEVFLVHICRNARGTLVCVHVVLCGMLLFCFIQEANGWPRPAFLLFFLRYCFDIFITWNLKQAYYKSFLSYIAHSFFSAFLFCMSFKTIHETLKILRKYMIRIQQHSPRMLLSTVIKNILKICWVIEYSSIILVRIRPLKQNNFLLMRGTRI